MQILIIRMMLRSRSVICNKSKLGSALLPIFIPSQSSVGKRAFNFPHPQFTTSLITEFGTPLVCQGYGMIASSLPSSKFASPHVESFCLLWSPLSWRCPPNSVMSIQLNYCADGNR